MDKYTKFILTVIAILLAGNIVMLYYIKYEIKWGLRGVESSVQETSKFLNYITQEINELND